MSRQERGFTLLELLVAVAILGVVMSMIYSSFYRTVESKEYVERGNMLYSMARIAMERMVRETSMAFLSSRNGDRNHTLFLGEDKDLEGYPADMLTFTSVSHLQFLINAKESDQNEITYFVIQDSETGIRTLMYREDSVIDEQNAEGGSVYELCEDILGIDFQYFNGEDWQDYWDSEEIEEGGERLPQAVQITLILRGPDNQELIFQSKSVIVMAK